MQDSEKGYPVLLVKYFKDDDGQEDIAKQKLVKGFMRPFFI